MISSNWVASIKSSSYTWVQSLRWLLSVGTVFWFPLTAVSLLEAGAEATVEKVNNGEDTKLGMCFLGNKGAHWLFCAQKSKFSIMEKWMETFECNIVPGSTVSYASEFHPRKVWLISFGYTPASKEWRSERDSHSDPDLEVITQHLKVSHGCQHFSFCDLGTPDLNFCFQFQVLLKFKKSTKVLGTHFHSPLCLPDFCFCASYLRDHHYLSRCEIQKNSLEWPQYSLPWCVYKKSKFCHGGGMSALYCRKADPSTHLDQHHSALPFSQPMTSKLTNLPSFELHFVYDCLSFLSLVLSLLVPLFSLLEQKLQIPNLSLYHLCRCFPCQWHTGIWKRSRLLVHLS